MIPKVALITLTSTGGSEVEGEDRLGRARQFTQEVSELITGLGVELMRPIPVAPTPNDVCDAVSKATEWQADCVVMLFPAFVTPDWVMQAVRELNLPLALWSLRCPHTWPLVGAALCRGAIADCGWQHRWFYGAADGEALHQVYDFARGAMIAQRLRGKRYGYLGGRTYGMYSTVFDYTQLMSQFGIEVHHADQLDLYLRSEAQEAGIVKKTLSRVIADRVVDGVPPTVLERSIREYLALHDMVRDYGWDFLGIKCQPEMTDHYCGACLGMALLNDDGISATCEADTNGALTNYMLQMLTDEAPFMGDTVDADPETQIMVLANCGAIAMSLADPDVPVRLTEQYECMCPKTGACTSFQCKTGAVTVARLYRCQGQYSMMMTTGEVINRPDSQMSPGRERWPHAFVRFPGNILTVVDSLLANHLHFAYGDYVRPLMEACELLDIDPLPL
jgi:L-fucose isomerase